MLPNLSGLRLGEPPRCRGPAPVGETFDEFVDTLKEVPVTAVGMQAAKKARTEPIPPTIFDATLRLTAHFSATTLNAACGPANICAALAAIRPGASEKVKGEYSRLFGDQTDWIQRNGRFVGCYMKDGKASGTVETEYTKAFETTAAMLGVELGILESAAQINEKVEKVTHGKIKTIVSQDAIDRPEIVLLALAAEYILVKWRLPFDIEMTVTAPFHTATGDKDCLLMSMNETLTYAQFWTAGRKSYQIAFLKTKQNEGNDAVSGMVALPEEGWSVTDMMRDIGERGAEIEGLLQDDPSGRNEKRVALQMPRLEVSLPATNVSSVVQDFGMVDAFDRDAYDKMLNYTDPPPGSSKQCNVGISAVVHATYLKWDETGAEASAATTVTTYRSLAAQTSMICNRPFACYLIDTPKDKSATVLFSMAITDGTCFDMKEPPVDD